MSKSDRIIPEIFVHDGPGAVDFYTRAFDAVEVSRMMTPDGKKLVHAELTLAGHRFFVCDEFSAVEGGTCRSPQTLGGTGVRIMLEVDDADRTVARARPPRAPRCSWRYRTCSGEPATASWSIHMGTNGESTSR